MMRFTLFRHAQHQTSKGTHSVPYLAKLQAESGKTRITVFLDNEVIAGFKALAAQSGKGYQTLINEALRISLSPESAPLTVEILRKILREELGAA